MWKLHQKLKKIVIVLGKWSKVTHGYIYSEPKRLKKRSNPLEQRLQSNNTYITRTALSKVKVDELECINNIITEESNASLTEIPPEEEIKNNLVSMDPDSAPRPNEFTTKFFQTRWGVVAPDIINVFHSIFRGSNVPKWLTHTNISMIRKVQFSQ
ncbi:hypothetical protein P3S67_010643 [Capsicum chacoense]